MYFPDLNGMINPNSDLGNIDSKIEIDANILARAASSRPHNGFLPKILGPVFPVSPGCTSLAHRADQLQHRD
jgi:hypothetical protein